MLSVSYLGWHRKLKHWDCDKMAAISLTTFSNAYSWMKMYEFRLRFHWSLFLKVQLTKPLHWQWLGADQVTSHYLNQWWLVYRRIYASLGLNELKVILLLTNGMELNLFHPVTHPSVCLSIHLPPDLFPLYNFSNTVETLSSMIYYSKYFIELHIDKSTQYVVLWTHKRHSIPRPFGRAMECLLWGLQHKLIVL